MILFLAEVITHVNSRKKQTHVNSRKKQTVSKPAAAVTGYLPIEINWSLIDVSQSQQTMNLWASVALCSLDLQFRLQISAYSNFYNECFRDDKAW